MLQWKPPAPRKTHYNLMGPRDSSAGLKSPGSDQRFFVPMTPENAAPCRHAGVVPDALVDQVVMLISELASDHAFLHARGLSAEEYSTALPIAIQRMRGRSAAANFERRQFLSDIFEAMLGRGLIEGIEKPKYSDDTVYRLKVPNIGNVAIIQKGCPDGAHSSFKWSVPEWAAESYLWWLCPSTTHEPGAHVAKGVNRLKKRFFSTVKGQNSDRMIDGVLFHNELCGTLSRPCPKRNRSVQISGTLVPPPCLYTFPAPELGASQWNWDGTRRLRFPSVLFALFGIQAAELPYFGGHIGFKEKGGDVRTTIASKFGLGNTTMTRT